MMIKNYFKNFKTIRKNTRLYRYFCPNCTVQGRTYTHYDCHAKTRYLWDEQYNKYKFFIKCTCGYTTPAFDTIEEAEDHWASIWAKVEDENTIKLFD